MRLNTSGGAAEMAWVSVPVASVRCSGKVVNPDQDKSKIKLNSELYD